MNTIHLISVIYRSHYERKINAAHHLFARTAKGKQLLYLFKEYGNVLIAYSGGVDSAYLAAIAYEALGKNAHLIIADSPSLPREELNDAVSLAEKQGWHLNIIKTTEFDNESFLRNDAHRCYYCKQELFRLMQQYAAKSEIPVIIHGETADDGNDSTRVGVKAAKEAGIKAPLALLGFSKDEIRERSRARNLPTWEKPSFACLASRIPTNLPISAETLGKIEAVEALLKQIGCRQYRARHHDEICRIEVELERLQPVNATGDTKGTCRKNPGTRVSLCNT